MIAIREALNTLGWPTQMSDSQIAEELLRRWFANSPDAPLKLADPAVVARGVYATIVRESGLDALCWSRSEAMADRRITTSSVIDRVVESQQTKHLRGDRDFANANRRKADRTPRSDLVDVVLDYGESRTQGWLVDVSSFGVAFLMDAVNVPMIGQVVEPAIVGRSGQSQPLGTGVIVRTEMLSTDLGLVCVELEEPCELVKD
ncbi:MAG: hypothetical protein H6817_11315 [Phycisphaerales bacterium]|nr:hypothetical protein [Phycisphaerales bacterium]